MVEDQEIQQVEASKALKPKENQKLNCRTISKTNKKYWN